MSEVFQRINWVDILVLILLIRTSYIGAHTGLSTEIFKVIGIFLGLYLGLKYYSLLGAWLSSKISLPSNVSESVTFSILILLSVLTLKLVELGLTKIVKLTFADKVNKWGGFIFGFTRGVVILGLVFKLFSLTQVDYLVKSVEERSLTGQYIQKIVPFTYQVIARTSPEETRLNILPKAGEKK